jgi:hypothetical protein
LQNGYGKQHGRKLSLWNFKKGGKMEKRLKDIITILPIKDYVRLGDGDKDPESITRGFVFTDDIKHSYNVILDKISKGEGDGFLIKGDYGSGKTDMLEYLSLLLKNKNLPPIESFPSLKTQSITIHKVYLREYGEDSTLERSFLNQLGYSGEVFQRNELYARLLPANTLVIIDELSEYLDTHVNSFEADVGFLVYLAEYIAKKPIWFIAALQEWVEETRNARAARVLQRLKERSIKRLPLSASHVEELIDRAIISKKDGADDVIKQVFSTIRKHFPQLQLTFEQFRQTYPLHPMTVTYLAGLTPIFSQARGVVQFVKAEVQKIIEAPADTLVTVDAIYDHFEERIRETPEYSTFARVVFDYYKVHIKEAVSGGPREQESALAALKMLILTEISTFKEKKITAREIGEMLLKRISSHVSDANYNYMEHILDQLVSHGMFIKKDAAGHYLIDVRSDVAYRIKSKINKIIADRLSDKRILFDKIVAATNTPSLKTIASGEDNSQVTWENSSRFYRCFLPTSVLKQSDIDGWVHAVETWADCCLVVLSPFSEENKKFPHHVAATYLSRRFLPLVAFWVPRTPLPSELTILETYLAKKELVSEFPNLSDELKKDDHEFQALMKQIYIEGEIIYATGEKLTPIIKIASAPLPSFVEAIFQDSFTKVYPNHHEIISQKYVSTNEMANLYENFLRKGNITIEDAKKKGILEAIKKFLFPLGIVKQKAQSFVTTIDVANELISYLLSVTSQNENLSAIKKSLQKSEWGLSRDQIDVLLSVLISSAQLVACNDDGMVDLREIAMLSKPEAIKTIKAGKTLSPALLSYVPSGKFIWGEIEDIPTPVTQRTMWRAAVEFLGESKKILDGLHNSIAAHRGTDFFKKIPVRADIINSLSAFIHSMPRSLTPAEGIERFLSYLRDNEELEADILYLKKLDILFSNELNDLKRFYLYLSHPGLKLTIPGGKEEISLERNRALLLAEIKEYLATLDGEFGVIQDKWDQFHSEFEKFYMEQHQLYYSSGVFIVKKDVAESEQARALQRITKFIDTENFPGEWWEIRKELERPPLRCTRDPNDDLLFAPVCKCGFQVDMVAPESTVNLPALCDEGILNFVRLLQSPAIKQKLDACRVTDSNKTEIAKAISKLTTIRVDKTSPFMVLPLLTNEVLSEIGEIVRGHWKYRDIRIGDLAGVIQGGRYKQKDLKAIILGWIGDDEETILHVKGETETAVNKIKDSLIKYGPTGDRAWIDIQKELRAGIAVDDIMEQAFTESILRSIKLGSFSIAELSEFLSKESINPVKRMLRGEIFKRVNGKLPLDKSQAALVTDKTMNDLLTMNDIITQWPRHSGVDLFVGFLAHLFLLNSKIVYDNAREKLLDPEIIAEIQRRLEEISEAYDGQTEKFKGAKSLLELKDDLIGNIVVLDGLRYDLWFMLKDIILSEGFTIKKEFPFVVPMPTSTANFRSVVGIDDEQGGMIGERTYSLTKWVERDASRRAMRKALKGPENLKFFHANFIDTKIHNSSLPLYPLYLNIESEFRTGILPLMEDLREFIIIADHGFSDTNKLKGKYSHGNDSAWERVLPCVYVGY